MEAQLDSLLKNYPTPARDPRFGSKNGHSGPQKLIHVLMSVPE